MSSLSRLLLVLMAMIVGFLAISLSAIIIDERASNYELLMGITFSAIGVISIIAALALAMGW